MIDYSSVSMTSDEEIEAHNLVERGEIDQAIAIYQRLKPQSDRVLHHLGLLYARKKDDHHLAIIHFQQALQIQEKVWNRILLLTNTQKNVFIERQ